MTETGQAEIENNDTWIENHMNYTIQKDKIRFKLNYFYINYKQVLTTEPCHTEL